MAATDVEVEGAAKWWRLYMACLISTLALNVRPVLGQGNGSQTGPVNFLENYVSQSDAQHFRLLNDGQQVQLVLDEYAGNPFRMPPYLASSHDETCNPDLAHIAAFCIFLRQCASSRHIHWF